MSTSEATTPAPGAAAAKEIRIYSHSGLYYWWPVWALGFLFALLTLIENNRLAIVPSDSVVLKEKIAGADGKDSTKVTIFVSGDGHQMKRNIEKLDDKERSKFAEKNQIPADAETMQLKPRVSHHSWMGPLFVMVLIVVIIVTNVPLRGLWSLVVIIGTIMTALIISLLGLWDDIFDKLAGLHIYINMAGYLFPAVVLLIGWLVSVFIFDKRSYIIFTPGQVKVCEQVGGREKVYDTTGMTIEKHRDDWFRHIFLGFGSGDMTVRTAGADRHEILMPNVALIGFKIGPIEQLLRQRPTTEMKS